MIGDRRKIPAKVLYSGDVAAARRLRGVADSQLVILEEQMSFQGLQQGARKLSLPNGVKIECTSCFSLHEIFIHVPTSGGKKDKPRRRDCYCWPCFSQGVVLAIDDIVNVTSFNSRSYSVGVCVDKSDGWDKYLQLEHLCLSLDCAQYSIGQPVMVSVAPGIAEYKMCSFPMMDAEWYIIVPINASVDKAPALKWYKNTEGGRSWPGTAFPGDRGGLVT